MTLRSGVMAVLLLAGLGGRGFAAEDVKVGFTLKTTNAAGKAVTQERVYYVYRPDNLPRDQAAPMVLCINGRPATFWHRKADEAGIVLVSCVITGHTNPQRDGFEDVDYADAVIERVSAAENCKDAFMCGLSMGGHMTCAYACERPGKIRAGADADQFMSLTSNVPTAAVPMLFMHGTNDTAVPYLLMKDTVDAWRGTNGLMEVTPVTTFESSPLKPGEVTMQSWEAQGKMPVSFVTIVGGGHAWGVPESGTGYDATDAMWDFFARFLTTGEKGVRIVSPPTKSTQRGGFPASFHVAAQGEGKLTYQWQKNGADIAGATSRWFTTGAVGKEDDGAVFRVVVSNGVEKVTSAGVALKVAAAVAGPAILVGPKDQTLAAGKAATFTVEAGSGAAFQWQENGMDIVGATGRSYTSAAAIPWDCGATFRVMVSDGSGRRVSVPATLTVTPAPGAPVIVTNPGRGRVHPGETATFTVQAKGAEAYQWQRGTFTGNYVDIAGATAASYTTPAAVIGDHRSLFRCVVSNASGSVGSAGEMLFVTEAGAATK